MSASSPDDIRAAGWTVKESLLQDSSGVFCECSATDANGITVTRCSEIQSEALNEIREAIGIPTIEEDEIEFPYWTRYDSAHPEVPDGEVDGATVWWGKHCWQPRYIVMMKFGDCGIDYGVNMAPDKARAFFRAGLKACDDAEKMKKENESKL